MAADDKADRIAEYLLEQYRRQQPFAPLPPELMPESLTVAYAAQGRFNAQRIAAGAGSVAGCKIALTAPVMQQMVGIDHPCAGVILSGAVHHGAARVRAEDYQNLGIECEIALRLGADLPPNGTPYDRDSVAESVAAAAAAIEIVDDRNTDYGRVDARSLIADNTFNRGCVLGPEMTTWRDLDLSEVQGEMTINGSSVGQGVGADVLGHPLAALAWLANLMADLGTPLTSGMIVMTGSVVATKWLSPGDTAIAHLHGLGEAQIVVD